MQRQEIDSKRATMREKVNFELFACNQTSTRGQFNYNQFARDVSVTRVNLVLRTTFDSATACKFKS